VARDDESGNLRTRNVVEVHEAGLMQTALEAACNEARRVGAIYVRRLVLRVGADAGVMPTALRFAFEALSPGTLAEGAKLDVEELTAGKALELVRVEVEIP
jgi:Zn finger protein HypA/HybF involved in hydrogenase expression